MRMRYVGVIAALFALFAPVASPAMEVAHGMVHEHEAASHAPVRELHSSVEIPSSIHEHETLHAAQRCIRLSNSGVDAALPMPPESWTGTGRPGVIYPPAVLLNASPQPQSCGRPRAPPAN